MNVEEVLVNLGYTLIPDSRGWRSSALYRDGTNTSSLLIYKDGNWTDFVESTGGTLEQLIKMTLRLPSLNHAKQWLETKKVVIQEEKPELTLNEIKIFPKEWLDNLKSDHNYWVNRGISKEVMNEFRGGVWTKDGAFKNYYTFPIFDSKSKLIGIAGRNTDNTSIKPKWRLKGEKKAWKYPLFLNHQHIVKNKSVVLVESIGNCLSLYEAGCKNVLVLFGTNMSFEIVNYLLKFDISSIIISTDNDGGTGVLAAEKIYRKIGKYFDKKNIEISLPYKKDFNEQSREENENWIKKYTI